MTKNYIHDIKPSTRAQKRRDLIEHEQELRARKLRRTSRNADFDTDDYDTPRSGGGRGIWYVAALAIVILVFALTFVFAGATVYVTPREGSVEISGPILAEKESRDGLSYETISLSSQASATAGASEKKYVERKAVGTVRLYNNNGTAPQKLLIDTRLESPDGYIYKTKTPVTVPGQKTEGGKTVPGSVDVAIYADEAGDVYNLKDKDIELKIVGFRGGPKYEKIYGKTTTPVEGGFKGDTYDLGEDELAKITEELETTLRADLIAKARAELPDDFIMYDAAATIRFENPEIAGGTEGGQSDKSEVRVAGTIEAYIFKQEDLTRALVDKVIAKSEENGVSIPNIRELAITLEAAEGSEVRMSIDDRVQVVWDISDEAVKEALVGVRRRDFESKMLEFKNIERAELALKPFWRTTLPDKPGAIKIVNTFTSPAHD